MEELLNITLEDIESVRACEEGIEWFRSHLKETGKGTLSLLDVWEYNVDWALWYLEEKGIFNVETFKYLIAQGVDVDLQDEDGSTALIMASRWGHIEIVRVLLKNNAKVDLRDEEGNTALVEASHLGRVKVVKVLLEKGASVNHQNEDGDTALMFASDYGHVDVVKMLLEKGADVNLPDEYGQTALDCAERNKHNKVIKILQKYSKKTKGEQTWKKY